MIKKIVAFLLVLAIILIIPAVDTQANGVPYNTYTYSSATHRMVWTQDAYLPLSISYNLGGVELSEPSDITIDENDNVYIADTGNGRVIKYSLQSDEVTIIGDTILQEPTGVHVGIDGHLYVADFGLKQAFKFSDDLGTYDVEVVYEKPVNTPYFTDEDAFDPTKIVTDRGGNVYLQLSGNINGLAEYENTGEFFGYFGGNTIPATFDNVIRYMLFDEQQRRDWFQIIPDPVYNIAVDHDGLILTTTKGVDGYLKLNIANFVYNASVWGLDTNEDLFVGPYETIYTITSDGYILEYSPDGQVLFVFGGTDLYGQKGLFQAPTGIAVDSKSNIFAIDKTTSSLQVFIPTEFSNLVHHAISLYQDGQYSESLGPWQEVLKMNALFDLANKGIGDAYFAQMDYEQAMTYYAVARDQDGYSNAFWEVRNEFLLGSGEFIIIILIALVVLYAINQFVHFMDYVAIPVQATKKKLREYKFYRDMVYSFTLIKHPSDGYYGIKREGQGSNLTALIYVILFFLAYILWIYRTSFLFNNTVPSEINLFQQVVTIFGPFFLWVGANYLVSTIRDGEGKLSDVFQASAYTLLPMIITLPILTLVSNGLTYNETFIYNTILYLGIAITVIYFIIMIKEIHFYDMRPTIANILITIFTAIMIVAISAIVYLLLTEVYGLFYDIVRELMNRG